MNDVTDEVLSALLRAGITEFVVCAGGRNHSFVEALKNQPHLKIYYGSEERSASYFALGRVKQTCRPVAVVVTSGTAAAELFPAVIEAHYTGLPLLLITADRPLRFRGSGAPQSIEQKGLFGCYARQEFDLEAGSSCDLSQCDWKGPVHINVCLEEPQKNLYLNKRELKASPFIKRPQVIKEQDQQRLHQFFDSVHSPLVMVSTLKTEDRPKVVDFLEKLQVPVILEGISGIRENPRLEHLRVMSSENLLNSAAEAGYPIDGVLRIGGVPTQRLWRDLEYAENKIRICSISDVPFSGLSWQQETIPMGDFLPMVSGNFSGYETWLNEDREQYQRILQLFQDEPLAEASLLHELSKLIPDQSMVYLGNSLPIREWDLAASYVNRGFDVFANRGTNGIEGQISTFLGTCDKNRSNWGIFGDLTTLYDLFGPWFHSQIDEIDFNIVIVNNGGGKFFDRIFPGNKEMWNSHSLNFAPLADLWGLNYERWESIPEKVGRSGSIIEIVPDELATKRFWEEIKNLKCKVCL